MNDLFQMPIKKGVDNVLDLIGTTNDQNTTVMGKANQILALEENIKTICNATAKETSLTEIKGMISELQENSGSSGSTVALTDDEKVLIAGNGYSTYSVGSVLKLHWGGAILDFVVAHKGYKTSNKIVLVSNEVLPVGYIAWDPSNVNNYSSSNLRGFLNNEVFSGFAPEIQAAIVSTPVACHNYTTAVTCNDKIWALSYAEAGLGTNTYAPAEGSALSYFNSATRRKKSVIWWLRTPNTNSTSNAWRVNTDGTASPYNCSNTYGVVPAFEI